MTLAQTNAADDVQEDIELTAQAGPAPAKPAPAYPKLREDHVLGASRLVKTYTPWRVYNALMGLEKERPFDPTGRLDIKMRNWLRQDAEVNYGLVVKRFDGDTSFVGPFHAATPDVIVDPGSLLGSPGDLLLIQTPAKESYEMTWKAGYELSIPASVNAKAQIRMSVTGAQRTLVWIVSDNGRINEFDYIVRDQAMIESLKRGCRDVLAAAERGEEPAPDDVDIEDYVLLRAGTKGARKVKEGSAEANALRDYNAAGDKLKQLNIDVKNAKISQDSAKRVMVEAMKDGSFLEMPDQTMVTMKKIDVKERVNAAYSYSRLDIKKPEKND